MKGRLTPEYTPYVELEIIEAGGEQEMVVDTGFNDYLYLPEDTIADWQLSFITSTPVSYADGSTVVADLYEADAVWFGTTVRVTHSSIAASAPIARRKDQGGLPAHS